jgi:hypothetical protein
MITLERYLKHERLYMTAGLATLLFINGTVIATSIIMEAQRSGRSVPIATPFITEYTSHLAVLLLVPLLIRAVDWFPLRYGTLRRSIAAHIVITVLFCLAHIGLFVALRKLAFGALGEVYIYSDDPLLSFVYEYRKDAWSYVLWIAGIHSYRFTLSRLRGEAVPVGESEEPAPNAAPERFLVRKLGREFVVRVDDVEWLEAAGNYVNLHVGERTYPLRATMNSVINELSGRGFVRIHRSNGVNLDFVESLTPLESGDATVTLRSGQTLALSRRYRDSFRQQFQQHGGNAEG